MTEGVMTMIATTATEAIVEPWQFSDSNSSQTPEHALSTVQDAENGTPDILIHVPAKPGPGRRLIALSVIAILLVAFGVIVIWGLVHSDWLYGNYGEIGQRDWDEIASLREQLARLGVAPEAVAALDDTLLLPHPSTEAVLYDLRKAVLVLREHQDNVAARRVMRELQTLTGRIERGNNYPADP